MDIKKRQSNIELCRIASILLVLLVHTTRRALGNDVSFGVLLLSGFSIIGVNTFVLITGYFSARPKKLSLLNLLFICFFWVIIRIIYNIVAGEPVGLSYLFFVSKSTWFIPCYIGLLFFAPFLNEFCERANKKALWGGVLCILTILCWFDWFDPAHEADLGSLSGYSLISFISIYLLGRAIRLHGLPEWFRVGSPIIYIVCSVVLAISSYIMLRIGHPGRVGWCFAYNNPIVIVSAVAFFTMFEKHNIKYSGFINHLSKSTLSVLLGHFAIMSLYVSQFRYLYNHYHGITQVALWALAVIATFVVCVIIDQLRLFLYTRINGKLSSRIKNNELFS